MLQFALADLKIFAASHLRLLDQKRAKGDMARIQEINFASDDEIIQKWLWLSAIVSGPVCFLVLPFGIAILQPFLWAPLAVWLWILIKCLMVLVFLLFLVAVVFTLNQKQQ